MSFTPRDDQQITNMVAAMPADTDHEARANKRVMGTVLRNMAVKVFNGDDLATAYASVRTTFYKSGLGDFARIIDLFEKQAELVAA